MEINHFLPSSISPMRSPTAVGDGDVGQNSPYYRGNQKKSKNHQEDNPEPITSGREDPSTHIDIRV